MSHIKFLTCDKFGLSGLSNRFGDFHNLAFETKIIKKINQTRIFIWR